MSLIDSAELPRDHTIEADLCIIGAGAAGLTLASEFAGRSLRVAIVEAGGLEPEPESQSQYRGEIASVRDFALDTTRLRYFGGTTNHWTAYVKPLDDLDFQERPWIPDSGWPLSRAELDPDYERVRRLFGLSVDPFAVPPATPVVAGPWPLDPARVSPEVYRILPEQECWLGPRFRPVLAASKNVDVYLHAAVTQIAVDPSHRHVTGLEVNAPDRKTLGVKARQYVLATGGIENARILLLSDRAGGRAVGNGHDLVGRYFANHPAVRRFAQLLPSRALRLDFYSNGTGPKGQGGGFLRLSDRVQREQELLNCRIGAALYGGPAAEAVAKTIAESDGSPGQGGHPSIRLTAITEQAPNRESRVRLGEDRDSLGQRRVVLDWRVSDRDTESLRRTIVSISKECGRAGLGRVRSLFPRRGLAALDLKGSYHHMGTTRMHEDSRRGVVDADCRVHGVDNLFVAGSSVFPTCGTANPTYTILALTFRLADHLDGLLR